MSPRSRLSRVAAHDLFLVKLDNNLTESQGPMKKTDGHHRFTRPLPPEDGELPPWRQPEYVLNNLVHNNWPEMHFFDDLMECVPGAEIGCVLKHLPADMFDEFKETLTTLDAIKEEDFFILGSVPAGWDKDEVSAVLRYLEAHPNPELAPPLAVLKAGAPPAAPGGPLLSA